MHISKALATAVSIATLTIGGFAACPAISADITVETARGPISVPEKPANVAVFDLSSLDTLHTLGVDVAGVPGSNLPPSLEQYKVDNYTKIGTLFEPDYETLNALQPDLIIIGGRSAAKHDELAKLAPVIDLTADSNNFGASIMRNATTLGAIFGKQAEVNDRIAKLEASVADLTVLGAKAGKALIVLTTGGKMSAYGPGSRFGELHGRFGIAAADPDLTVETHGQVVSYEYILEKNPDWLFVIDRDAAIGQSKGQSAEQMLDNDLVHATNAWKKGQVVYLDPVKMYLTSGGLAAEQGIVDDIASALKSRL
ncbi:siderophore ABC transporter substrate-binding protein [Agrobacterium sp. ES01]|uniref:siderophore ABC transporter substrate-binding protein n=1 Tax=Agrobacterium sp. ES01 TaxID=3420714 RepID=UPI003D11420D